MQNLRQYFYVYDIEDRFGNKHKITERITFFEDYRPQRLDIPGWQGWLDELVMQGKHPF